MGVFAFFSNICFADVAALESELQQAQLLQRSGGDAFIKVMTRLEQQRAEMSPHQRWELNYLQGWKLFLDGSYEAAAGVLGDINVHADTVDLRERAGSRLVTAFFLMNRNREAFAVANRLIQALPDVSSKVVRVDVLDTLSTLLREAGKYDLAVDYARRALDITGKGMSVCRPTTYLATVLYDEHQLASDGQDLREAIHACEVENNPIYLDVLQTMQSEALNDENRPSATIDLLRRIEARVEVDGYVESIINLHAEWGRAALLLGNPVVAHREALKALSLESPEMIDQSARTSYYVLYEAAGELGEPMLSKKYLAIWEAKASAYQQSVREKASAYELAKFDYDLHQIKLKDLEQAQKLLTLQEALDTKETLNYRLFGILLAIFSVGGVFFGLRLRKQRARYKMLAEHDGLTGAFNHQAFVKHASDALRDCQLRKQDACLILLDLDHFKQINDTYGHGMGDEVLLRSVALVQPQLPAKAYLGRVGGEEFGIFLPGCAREQAIVIAECIRGSFESAPVHSAGDVVQFTASFGVACSDRHGYVMQELVRQADLALYRAKHAGRNCVISDLALLRPAAV